MAQRLCTGHALFCELGLPAGPQLRTAETGAHPASAVDAGRLEKEGATAARSAVLSPWQGWGMPLLALRSSRSLRCRGPLYSIVIPTPSRKPRYHA